MRIFIELDSFMSIELEGFIWESQEIEIGKDKSISLYGMRYSVMGVIISCPSFLDFIVEKYYPYSELSLEVRHKRLKRKILRSCR